MSILDEIMAYKRAEVSRKKAHIQEFKLDGLPAPRDFKDALQSDGISLIAELKRCSPSRTMMRDVFDPPQIANICEKNGAVAISVLTDERFFCGSDTYVPLVKRETNLPVLRKEFILDAFQIYESRALGADAILLIASVLEQSQIVTFLSVAEELGLSCLVEVHTRDDMEKVVDTQAQIIGINNRNLTTLDVDVDTSLNLRKLIPPGRVTVSESGIQTRDDVLRLEEAGFDAMLVGESLMNSPDIASKVRDLLGR